MLAWVIFPGRNCKFSLDWEQFHYWFECVSPPAGWNEWFCNEVTKDVWSSSPVMRHRLESVSCLRRNCSGSSYRQHKIYGDHTRHTPDNSPIRWKSNCFLFSMLNEFSKGQIPRYKNSVVHSFWGNFTQACQCWHLSNLSRWYVKHFYYLFYCYITTHLSGQTFPNSHVVLFYWQSSEIRNQRYLGVFDVF